MKAMTVSRFDKLTKADFLNGAILDEIRTALRQRQDLLELLINLAYEIDNQGLVSALDSLVWYNADDYIRSISS